MERFALLRLAFVFLAAAAPCGVLAQTQTAPKPAPTTPKPVPGVPASVVVPPTDLLAEVRGYVSRLRSVPLASSSQSLHENSAQKAEEQVKVLHNWNGEPASAGWAFSFGKSKQSEKPK